MHGIGTYTNSNLVVYTGQFIMNSKQGIGKQTKNGTEYGIWSGIKIGILDFEED